MNASVPVGVHLLLPLVPEFVARHPEIVLELSFTDTVVDLLEDRCDVALRSGPMKDSSLIARRLGESRVLIVAAPGYLARRGVPQTPADLRHHKRARALLDFLSESVRVISRTP